MLRQEPRLLDRRDPLIRFSGLHFVLMGCKPGTASDDHFECVKYLIEQGAPVDTRNVLGFTVLGHCLANLGLSGMRIADYLLEQGADVNARDRLGEPMLFKRRYYEPTCEEWLLRNGADFNALSEDGTPFKELFADESCNAQIGLHIYREFKRQGGKPIGKVRIPYCLKKSFEIWLELPYTKTQLFIHGIESKWNLNPYFRPKLFLLNCHPEGGGKKERLLQDMLPL